MTVMNIILESDSHYSKRKAGLPEVGKVMPWSWISCLSCNRVKYSMSGIPEAVCWHWDINAISIELRSKSYNLLQGETFHTAHSQLVVCLLARQGGHVHKEVLSLGRGSGWRLAQGSAHVFVRVLPLIADTQEHMLINTEDNRASIYHKVQLWGKYKCLLFYKMMRHFKWHVKNIFQ